MSAGKTRKRAGRRGLRRLVAGIGALAVAVVVAVVAALSALDAEELRATVERQAERLTGRQLTVAGPVDLALSLRPAVVLEDVRVANAPWASREALATVERFELELALLPLVTGEVRVERLVLVGADVLLERDAAGRGNWQPPAAGEEGAAAAAEPAALPQVRRLRVERGRIAYRGPDGATRQVSVAHLSGRAEGPDAPLELAGKVRARGLDVRLAGTVGAAAAGEPLPVDLRLEAAGATLSLKGEVAAPLAAARPDLSVSLEGDELAALGKAAGAKLPAVGAYRLAGRLTRVDGIYRLEGLELKAGATDLAGGLSLALDGPRPKLSGRLTGARLDLAGLAAGGPPDGGPGARRLFPEEVLPLEALRAVDAELSFKLGALDLSEGLRLAGVEGELRLADGRLAVAPLLAELGGGGLAGEVSLDAWAAPPALAVELEAEGVDYGRLLADLAGVEGVSGHAGLRARLTGRGASPHALAAGLDGRLEVVGGEGRVANRLLDLAGGGLQDALQPWTATGGDMRLNCVLARFDVASGVAASRVLLMDTERVTFGGEGTVDLGAERLDLRIIPEAKQASLMSLAVPVRLQGHIADPRIGPDPAGTAKAGAIAFGTLVNPLATLGALIIQSETAEQNPCVAALEKARAQGGAAARQEPAPEGGVVGGVKGFLEGLGKAIDERLGVGKGE